MLRKRDLIKIGLGSSLGVLASKKALSQNSKKTSEPHKTIEIEYIRSDFSNSKNNINSFLNDIPPGSIVICNNYYKGNIGTSSISRRLILRSDQYNAKPDEWGDITLINGNILALINERGKLVAEHFGADSNLQDNYLPIQAMINYAIAYGDNKIEKKSSGHRISIELLGQYYLISQGLIIRCSGERNIILRGISRPVIKAINENIDILKVESDFDISKFYEAPMYEKRISRIVIENIEFEGKNKTGLGLSIKYFGWIHLKNLNAKKCNIGFLFEHGSELSGERVSAQFNNIGHRFFRYLDFPYKSQSTEKTLTTDMIARFSDCYVTNNDICNIEIDGARYIEYTGGNYSCISPNKASVWIHSSKSPVNLVEFRFGDHEFSQSSPNFLIGSIGEKNSIENVTIRDSWFSSRPEVQRVEIINNLKKLNIDNVFFDNSRNDIPDFLIRNTWKNSLDQEILMSSNGFPVSWKIRDYRNENNNVKSNLSIISSASINGNPSFMRYLCNYLIEGSVGYYNKDKNNGAVIYPGKIGSIMVSLHNNLPIIKAGTKILVDFTCAFPDDAKADPGLCLEYITTNGRIFVASTASTKKVFKAQFFQNGLIRHLAVIEVPVEGLAGIALSNRQAQHTKLLITEFAIYSPGLPRENKLYCSQQPVAGRFQKGELVINSAQRSDEIYGWLCTQSGDLSAEGRMMPISLLNLERILLPS